jgi:hypothetical protein
LGRGSVEPEEEDRELGSAQIVVGLLIAVRFDGLGLIIGIENHIGVRTDITIIAPPARSEHRLLAMGAIARRRFAVESGFKPRPHASQGK